MRITKTTAPLNLLHGDGKLYDVGGDFLCDTKYSLYGTIRIKTTRKNDGSEEVEKNMWRDGTLSPSKWDVLRDAKDVILELDDGRRLNLIVTDSHVASVRNEPALF